MSPDEIKCREAELGKREEEMQERELNYRYRAESIREKEQGAAKGIIIVTIIHSLLIGMLLAKIIFQ